MYSNEPTVFVIDDDEAVRDALKMLLRAAGLKVEAFASAAAFLKSFGLGDAGCLVLDIRMPGMSGLALQEEMANRRITIPVIFLTGHADVSIAVQTMKRGAFDFIEKPIDSQRLIPAVRNALQYSDEQRNRTGTHGMPIVAPDVRLDQLSEREREVLDMVLQGRPTRVIAEDLSISVKTVEFHRARIREKLGVGSLAELFKLVLPR